MDSFIASSTVPEKKTEASLATTLRSLWTKFSRLLWGFLSHTSPTRPVSSPAIIISLVSAKCNPTRDSFHYRRHLEEPKPVLTRPLDILHFALHQHCSLLRPAPAAIKNLGGSQLLSSSTGSKRADTGIRQHKPGLLRAAQNYQLNDRDWIHEQQKSQNVLSGTVRV